MLSTESRDLIRSSCDSDDKRTENKENAQTVDYGIVFCLTGQEKSVVERLKTNYPMIRALSPVKLRYRRTGGVAREEKITLFPGYVFIEASGDIDALRLSREPGIIKLLCGNDQTWRLSGQDRKIVAEYFKYNGIIGFSKAYFDISNRIHILSGFLKEYEGQIIRVDRRQKTAEICVSINGLQIRQ